MEVLNLDIIDWSKAAENWYEDYTKDLGQSSRRKNFFAEDVLGLSLDPDQESTGPNFPVLRALILRQVSFEAAVRQLARALSVSKLKELKLWNCPQTSELLTYLTAARDDLHLVSLEVTCGYGFDNYDDTWELGCTVPPFLRKFSGLKDMYISLPLVDWHEVAQSVCNHLDTLQRVAIHARTIDIDEESPYYQEEQDGDPGFLDGWFKLFTRSNCEVIGMLYPPSFAVSEEDLLSPK